MIVHSGPFRSFPAQFSYIRRCAPKQNSLTLSFCKGLVDVAGIEPATPCLQIQIANLDGVKKNEKK